MFINSSQIIGIVIGTATETTTGSMFITLGIILMLILAIAIMFGIPLEFTLILVFPLTLTYMAYYSEFIATGFSILIYFAIILTKNWFLR